MAERLKVHLLGCERRVEYRITERPPCQVERLVMLRLL